MKTDAMSDKLDLDNLLVSQPDPLRDTILDTGEVLIGDVFIQTIIDGQVETVWTNKNDLRVV